MPHFQPGNSHGIATRFKPGVSGNPKGGNRPASASIREHWNSLLSETPDGAPRHTVADLQRIVDAATDDEKVSTAQRIAAQQILEACKGGRQGLEVIHQIFDRLEGRPGQHVSLSGQLTADPAQEITQAALQQIRDAAAGVPLLPES